MPVRSSDVLYKCRFGCLSAGFGVLSGGFGVLSAGFDEEKRKVKTMSNFPGDGSPGCALLIGCLLSHVGSASIWCQLASTAVDFAHLAGGG